MPQMIVMSSDDHRGRSAVVKKTDHIMPDPLLHGKAYPDPDIYRRRFVLQIFPFGLAGYVDHGDAYRFTFVKRIEGQIVRRSGGVIQDKGRSTFFGARSSFAPDSASQIEMRI